MLQVANNSLESCGRFVLPFMTFHVSFIHEGKAAGGNDLNKPPLTEQRWQPVDIGLAVGVQEGDDVPDGHRGSQHAGPDQPFPLLGAQDPHVRELGHVILQAFLQVFCGKRRHWHTATTRFLKRQFCAFQLSFGSVASTGNKRGKRKKEVKMAS